MESADWRRIEAALADEVGTLPDGIAEDVGIDGWQKLLHLVRDHAWRSEFHVDQRVRPLPRSAADLFQADALGILKMWLAPTVQINLFPYSVDDINFDFDARQMGDGGLSMVGDFIRDLGRTLQKPVSLTYEGDGTGVFLTYDPATDAFASPI